MKKLLLTIPVAPNSQPTALAMLSQGFAMHHHAWRLTKEIVAIRARQRLLELLKLLLHLRSNEFPVYAQISHWFQYLQVTL